jgi:transglutaminase-like putative cysteine protease
MKLQAGFELIYEFWQPTPIIAMLNVHHTRVSDLIVPDRLITDPMIPMSGYRDEFGNWCKRGLAPAGRLRLTTDCVIRDNGLDEVDSTAWQDSVEDLPRETLMYLLGSRYCETDTLSQTAWQLFGHTVPGYQRVQAICDFVHNHIWFNYQNARSTRTATEAFTEKTGVCRDYAHLAITFCRCMNIPARYCTGYLGDVGTPPPYPVGDFAAWFEVWIGGKWYTFDPRNNVPRMSRILMAQGRDACDVAMITTFGPGALQSFKVWNDEIPETENIDDNASVESIHELVGR